MEPNAKFIDFNSNAIQKSVNEQNETWKITEERDLGERNSNTS